MTINELPGTYHITGSNQDEAAVPYKGTLDLSLDATHHRTCNSDKVGTNDFQK